MISHHMAGFTEAVKAVLYSQGGTNAVNHHCCWSPTHWLIPDQKTVLPNHWNGVESHSTQCVVSSGRTQMVRKLLIALPCYGSNRELPGGEGTKILWKEKREKCAPNLASSSPYKAPWQPAHKLALTLVLCVIIIQWQHTLLSSPLHRTLCTATRNI